jgi:hypothetical protein
MLNWLGFSIVWDNALFWLELDVGRWCHLLQVISFQLALEPLFLVILQFGGI